MGYYDDDDVEEQIKHLDKLEQGLRVKQQRDFMRWRDQTVNDELKKAAEELGVSPEDFARHMSDPNYEKDLRRATRKLVEGLPCVWVGPRRRHHRRGGSVWSLNAGAVPIWTR